MLDVLALTPFTKRFKSEGKQLLRGLRRNPRRTLSNMVAPIGSGNTVRQNLRDYGESIYNGASVGFKVLDTMNDTRNSWVKPFDVTGNMIQANK